MARDSKTPITVNGVAIPTISSTDTLTNKDYSSSTNTPPTTMLDYKSTGNFDAGTNAVTDITPLSITVTPQVGRKIRIRGLGNIYMSGTVRRCDCLIREGTTILATSSNYPPAANNPVIVAPVADNITPSAGSHTYKLSIQCAAGANVSMEESQLVVEYV